MVPKLILLWSAQPNSINFDCFRQKDTKILFHVSIEADVLKDGFGDGVLDGDVDQLDVLGVGGAGRLNEDLPVARVLVPGSSG